VRHRAELVLKRRGSSSAASLRLEKELREVVVKPLPKKLHVSAFKVREPHPAPTAAAIALDKAHVEQVQQATMKLVEICNQGVFIAGRAAMGLRGGSRQAHPVLPAQAVQLAAATLSVHAAPLIEDAMSGVHTVVAPRRIVRQDAKLSGQFLVDDGVKWRVLVVEWSDEVKLVVAWYYNVQEAAVAGYDHSTMKVRFDKRILDSPEILFADIEHIRLWASQALFSGSSAP
jgi:hypothetical protein